MKETVPDMPENMQASGPPAGKVKEDKGLLGKLDATEFFKNFVGVKEEKPDEPDVEPVPISVTAAGAAFDFGDAADPDAPDPALYEQYYPAGIRYLAPEILIQYEDNFCIDRVGVAMTEVTASATDVYFPKETKGKAPMIDVSYNGSLNTASVQVSMKDVEGLPTLPPPAKQGEAVTVLTPGAGGGLKLEYSVLGLGAIDL